MEESKEKLRLRFQAETDVVIEPYPEDWKQYAEWLENLAIKELNNEMVKENELLLKKIREAMDALEEGIKSV
ncbi:MAG: hypothetical protein AABZ10_00060 [Nitrospirota bacterium]